MASDFYYPTTKNGIQKTLAAQLLSTATTGDAITFGDVEGLDNVPGVLVINRINSNGESTPSSREFISYSGTSGNTVLIETRDVDSAGTARTHAVGSIVEFVADAVWAKRLIDQFKIEHNADGTHNLNVGWSPVYDTWAYASATTITVPSGAASLYQKGDKLRLKQGAGYKYYYIVGVADTVLTVTGGSNYTVANAAITDIAISRAANPLDFPGAFSFTTTPGGFSAAPTVVTRFFLIGSMCCLSYRIATATASNANTFTLTAPITSANVVIYQSAASGTDNGASVSDVQLSINTNTTTVEVLKNVSPSGWTASGNKRVNGTIWYQI